MSDEVAILPPQRTRVWRATWMIVATIAIGWILVSLFRTPPRPVQGKSPPDSRHTPREPVQVSGPSTISVVAEMCRSESNSAIVDIQCTKINFPILSVSGSIVARVVPGIRRDRRSLAIQQCRSLDHLRGVAQSQERNQICGKPIAEDEGSVSRGNRFLGRKPVRLTPLAESGSIAQKQHREAKTNLIKGAVARRKEHLRVPIDPAGCAERQNCRGTHALPRGDRAGRVRTGHREHGAGQRQRTRIESSCWSTMNRRARPGSTVTSIGPSPHTSSSSSPSVTPDRRTLRVLIDLNDPKEVLRPGMFAEVGLGTNERNAVLVPAEALLHIAHRDYIVIADDDEAWCVEHVTGGRNPRGDV